MFSLRCIVVCLAVTAATLSEASVARRPAEVHADHPNECFIEETQSYLQLGDSRYVNNCGEETCLRDSNNQLFVETLYCGVVAAGPGCRKIPQDRFSTYPTCCPKLECGPSGGFSAVGKK